MVSYPVYKGFVGVSRSADLPCVLLQVTDDTQQARAVLTVEQALEVVSRLQGQILLIQMDHTHEQDSKL